MIKKTYTFYGIITIIMIILQSIIGFKMRTNPTWDLGITINAANEIIENGHMTNMAGYFVNFPNNIFNAVVLTVLFKFFGLFGLHSGNGPRLILIITLIQLSLFLIHKISKQLFENLVACFNSILALLFIPFYTYSSICYTDAMSMFIPVAFVYLFMKMGKSTKISKSWYYYVLVGLLIFLALKIKVTVVIMFITIMIVILFSRKILSKRWKYLVVSLCLIITSFLYFNSCYIKIIDHSKILNVKYKEIGSIPYTIYWAMMGTYDFEKILPSNAREINKFHEFFLSDGKYYDYVYYFYQTYYFSMLILILKSLFYYLTKKEKLEVTVIKLETFGLLIFLLIWETRTRYMLLIYSLLMTSGIIWFSRDYKNVLKRIFIDA